MAVFSSGLLVPVYVPLFAIANATVLLDGANVEIAEGVGSENVLRTPWNEFHIGSPLMFVISLVFFGHLTPAVKELRYQHKHHPVPVEEKSRDEARVLGPGFIKTFRRWKCVRAVRS
ncbi:hypothetical protein EDD16DRAFT_1556959 [Pisolithus croceorrhizus]|nr:hypothetical protein EDD16DRAFT_1556959 [Pisolithus croceorrhizus]